MMSRVRENQSNNDGFALPVVLGFLFLVAMFAIPFVMQARLNFKSSAYALQSDRLQFLARGLLEVLAEQLLETNPNLLTNGTRLSCQTPASSVHFSIQDHRGLIDLNASGSGMLALGFRALNLSPSDARAAARFVVAGRTLGSIDRQSIDGAWDVERNSGLFFNVLELTDLKMARNATTDMLSSVFTVHSKSGQLNKALASSPILKALAVDNTNALPVDDAKAGLPPSGVYTLSLSLAEVGRPLSVNESWVFSLNAAAIEPVQMLSSIPSIAQPQAPRLTNGNCRDFFPMGVIEQLERVS